MTPATTQDTDAEGAEDTARRLLALIQELGAELRPGRAPAHALTLDSRLEREPGLDSLGRVELFARIEHTFGIALPDATFNSAETPRDLLRAVLGARGPRAALAQEVSRLQLGEVAAVPGEARTLVEMLDWHVRAHPERPHILLYSDDGEDEIISYGRLRQGAEAVAAGLQYRGLQPGAAVAIMLPTGRDYFYSFYGILLAGGVPVPLYPPARPAQIEEHLRRQRGILASCLAATLITVPQARPVARLLKSLVESLREVVTVEELAGAPGRPERPALGPGDTAFLQYTSGSTGNPKGVVLTHANLLANIRAMGETVQVDASDVFVSWLPLYHDMGLIGAWLGTQYYAALLVIMPPTAFLTRPQRWLWAIHRYRGTLSAGPNFAYGLCLRKIAERELAGLDLSSWRLAFNGAEPVSPDTVEQFAERLRPYGFRREAMTPVYGLAESSVGLAFPPLHRGPIIDRIRREPFTGSGRAIPAPDSDTRALRFVACGRPLPGHQIRIVDAAGRELPERQEGRLQFRGPSATSGYFRNAEATHALFHGDWLESGDLAYIAEGDVYITGRIKDVIIRAGRNIYPVELEEAVGDLAGIRKGCVAAFGSPDPVSGTERLIVVAETHETEPAVLERLRSEIDAVAGDLLGAPPDDTVLAPPRSILKTSSGKIRRAASRDLYESGRIGRAHRAPWRQVARLRLAAMGPGLRRLARALAAALYAAYAWGLFLLLAPLTWTAVAVLPPAWRWRFMRAAARGLSRAAGTPIIVRGLERLPPPGRPCVYVANHASYLDGYALVAALPRQFSFVAKAEFARGVLTGVFLRRIEAAFVERFDQQRGVSDARRVAGAARAGRSLLFFPEGTFTRVPGLAPFHMGAFVAAVEAGVPVVPIALRGTRSILRDESWFPRRGPILVTIGAPIDPPADADPWSAAVALRDAARAQILRAAGEPDLAAEPAPP